MSCMTVESTCFVDTNVLLYVIDATSAEKRERAVDWMSTLRENGTGRTSWQVLNEFYSNATRKFRVQPRDVRPVIEELALWQPVGFGLGLVQQAWTWSDRASLSYWDALILSAAEYSGSRFLLSEDFQEGRTFGVVRVINPFHTAPPR